MYYLHELNSVVQTNEQYLKMYVTSNTLEISYGHKHNLICNYEVVTKYI